MCVRTGGLCTVCALNEMNACAQAHPNYREWRGEISGKKERGVVMQAEMGQKNDVQRLEKKIKEAKGELEKWKKKKLNKKR